MSVTMHLYKIIDAEYIGNELMLSEEEYNKLKPVSEWSDGKEHNRIDITTLKQLCNFNKKKIHTLKHLNKFNRYIFKGKYYTFKYIPVDEISYWQGWNLKNRFFKKHITIIFCITKQQMYNFMKRYLKLSEWTMFKEKFIDKMVDGEMIFECVW